MSTPQANPSNPLDQLRDIHLPDPISWWPPAPGWWLLLGLLVIFTLLGWLAYRWYCRGAIKRAALTELERISNHYKEQALLQQLSQLLRRVALATHPRQQVAGLQNQAWLEFLDRFVTGSPFSDGVGTILADGPYQSNDVEYDATALIRLSKSCILGLFKQGGRYA